MIANRKIIPLVALALCLTLSKSASADVQLCNMTGNDIWVAFAVGHGKVNTLHGWRRLTSGDECRPILSSDRSGGFYIYVAARKSDGTSARIAGRRYSSDDEDRYNWCVKVDLNEQFTVTGQWHKFEPPCGPNSMVVAFQKYLIQQGENVATVSFVD
jgi:uncharacterized membrane protein